VRALRYYLADGWASLRTAWRSAALAVVTVGSALFVLGLFLVASTALQQVLDGWARAAELSVYLHDGIDEAARQRVEATLEASPLVDEATFVHREEAGRRFAADFPEFAALAASLDESPFPASYEVRLRGGPAAETGVGELAAQLGALEGVSDVRYDQGLVERVAGLVRMGQWVALGLATLLALTAALAIFSVIRLSYVARQDEVEILLLVGAPLPAIRGPFIAEGWMQGTAGAALALAALVAIHRVVAARYGGALSEALGLERVPFLSWPVMVAIVLAGGAIGALAAMAAIGRRVLARQGPSGDAEHAALTRS
jgi:cell division transport system permease protein